MARYVPLILFSVLTNCLSQILLKKGMTSVPAFETSLRGVLGSGFEILFNPYVFFGLVTMVISMGSHLVVLSRVELSFAYPFLGLSFALITLYGHWALQEQVNGYRMLGVFLICVGVALVARSG